jgi:hypothetical protein
VRTFVSGLIVESLNVMVARSHLECYISRANWTALLTVIKSMCDVDVELDADTNSMKMLWRWEVYV